MLITKERTLEKEARAYASRAWGVGSRSAGLSAGKTDGHGCLPYLAD